MFIKHLLVRDLLSRSSSKGAAAKQRNGNYLEWISSHLIGFTNEFVQENKLLESYFIRGMNKAFKTTRFELLLKRWMVEYLEKTLKALDDSDELILEDNSINRFIVEKYRLSFTVLPKIEWTKQPILSRKLCSILIRCAVIVYISLSKGMRISGKRKKYKVMREALWGLYDVGGYYFHDDFFIDGHNLKKEDLLLFSRGISAKGLRLKARHDVKRSPYAHFDLQSLSIGIGPFFSRIIPKYIISGSSVLFREINSDHFSLYWGVYLHFKYSALPYEKVFSHFEVISELADNSFTAAHIPEAIVCQNYGTKCYLMVYSDLAIKINEYMLSFLGCDGYMAWGSAHITGVEGEERILMLTGFPFKRFVKEVIANRKSVLSDMGIAAKGKIITFFDESFGGECKMTEENFVVFWETALKLAQTEEGSTVLIKPKELNRYHNLSDGLKKRFIDIKTEIENMPNAYIIDEIRWSFIECIGVSDIVVTQGMTSSATIAIICGIEGLYLDEARYGHPFSALFKGRIVFDDRLELLEMINKIIAGSESPLKDIPESLLRDFDAHKDDMGIDRFRDVLCETKGRKTRENRRAQCP